MSEGPIRIGLTGKFAEEHLVPLLARSCREHPTIRLDLDVSPRNIDLVSEGFELAVRMGPSGQQFAGRDAPPVGADVRAGQATGSNVHGWRCSHIALVERRDSPREILANPSRARHLRCVSN